LRICIHTTNQRRKSRKKSAPVINHFFSQIQFFNFFQSKIYRASLSIKKEAQKPSLPSILLPWLSSKSLVFLALSLFAACQPSPMLLKSPQFTAFRRIMTILYA